MFRRILTLMLAVLVSVPVGAAAELVGQRSPAWSDPATAANFWLATSTGSVYAFGSVPSLGGVTAAHLVQPVVATAATSDHQGYWLVGADGGVFTFGDAGFFGSTGALRLAQPIVGVAPTPDGAGYWLVARDGGVFSFGDAGFYGSTGAIPLAQPIVDMTPTPDGRGYWLVARDGGVFSFGDAHFYGSAGGTALTQPAVGLTSTPDGGGYWLLTADGGVFSYGDARYYGSTGSSPPSDPAEVLVPTTEGAGYWIVDQSGTDYAYGDASGPAPTQALMFQPRTQGDKAVLFAFSQLGKPYIWGGNGPVGYDCSGLALASYVHADGMTFARVADDQYRTAGLPVPLNQLEAGDLVFWGDGVAADWTSVYHTAIYVGGDRIVEATGDHVQLNSLNQWGNHDVMPHGMRP
jgi:cell wall-associated NlpC family hydrolase